MSENDERALLDRALTGDSEAFGDLVDVHSRVLYNLALRMTGNAEDARDVTQSAFVKAWERLHTFDRENRLFSWLYRITLNEALNLRRGRRPGEALEENRASDEPGPETRYEREEEDRDVQRALLRLGPRDREILVMRHFLGMSHEQMGGLLHVPDKTVKSRLHSARVRLEGELRLMGYGGGS